MPTLDRSWRPARSLQASAHFVERLEELRSALRLSRPEQIAARSGAAYLELGPGRGELHLPLWGQVCVLCWPALNVFTAVGAPVPDFQQALLLYYLVTADGSPLREHWVSFAELPDGRIYNAAFQGYSGDALSKTFALDIGTFRSVCSEAGGREIRMASAAYRFQALPCVPLLVNYWLGDEDFPSSCKLLFDESVVHYLPLDACAILGGMLVRKLIHP